MSDQQTLATNFTAEIGDVLTKLSSMLKGILELAASSSTFASAMGVSDAALKQLTSSISKADIALDKFGAAFKTAGTDAKALGSVIKGAVDGINQAAAASQKGSQRSDEYKNALLSLSKQFGENKSMLSGLSKELKKVDDEHQKLAAGRPGQAMDAMYQSGLLAAEAVRRYTSDSKTLQPQILALDKAQAALGNQFDASALKNSNFGKVIANTAGKSEAYFKTLIKGAETYGIQDDKILSFTKNLGAVDKHLQSLTTKSFNYGEAQKTLADSTQMFNLATELMKGNLEKTANGFEIVRGSAKASGVVMTQFGDSIKSLSDVHKNLGSEFKKYTELHQKNSVAVEQGASRLQSYTNIVDQVTAAHQNNTKSLLESGQGAKIYSAQVLKNGSEAKHFATAQKEVIKALYDTDVIEKVLNGTQKVTLDDVMRLAAENPKAAKSVQELAKNYSGLNKGLEEVSRYGKEYANSLTQMTEKTFTNKAAVDQAVASHLKVAKTSESLISQHRALSDELVRGAKSQNEFNGVQMSSAEYVKAVNAAHKTFTDTLRSEDTIKRGVTESNTRLKDSLISLGERTAGVSEAFSKMKSIQGQLLDETGKHGKVAKTLNDQMILNGMSFEQANKHYQNYLKGFKAGEAIVKESANAHKAHNAVIKETPGLFSKIISTVQNFAVFAVASSVIGAFVMTIRSTISTIANFDQTLHSLKAITGATTVEMAGMGDVIKEVSSTSRYSTEEIGRGLEIMGQAGLSATESVNAIAAASDLATGTLEKMENVVDLLTSTLSAFQIDSMESARVADIMAIAVNKSKLSIDKLRTALNYVSVIAHQSGLTLEQTSASLAILSDRGMKASTIGTGFRQVLDKLIAPNEKLREAYQAHGIALDQINPLTVGYDTALGNLTRTLYDSKTQTVDTAKAFELFGIRGAQAATILIQAFASGEWQDTIKSFDEVGAASSMAAEQMEGLSAQWDRLVAKVKVLMVSLGEGGLAFILKGIVKAFSFFADGIQAFLDFDFGIIGDLTQYLILLSVVLVSGAVAAVAYNAAWTTIALGLNGLPGLLTTIRLKIVMLTQALITNPFILALTAITALVLALALYESQLKELIETHNKTANAAQQSSNALTLFQKIVKDSANDADKLKVNVARLAEEFPELAKEIAEIAGVSDVALLSQEQLLNAMVKLKEVKLNEALDESTKALALLQTQVVSAADGYAFLNHQYDFHVKATEMTKDELRKLGDQIKATAEFFVAYGRKSGESLTKSRENALAELEVRSKSNEAIQQSYKELTTAINVHFDQLEAKQRQSSIKYEKYTNEVGEFYKNLSIKQRAEVQNMVNEEEKAVERFEKFAADRNLSAEEKEAGLYAIHLNYRKKILATLNEYSKKEYETTEEKYKREQALIGQNLILVKQDLDKQHALYEELAAKGEKLNADGIVALRAHQMNIETLNEEHENLLRAQRNVTFEHDKKLLADRINELKLNSALEMTLLEGFELEKIKLAQATSNEVLRLKSEELKKEQEYIAKKKAAGTASEADIAGSAAREKQLIAEVTQAKTDSINQQIAEGKIWLDKNNEYMTERLEATKASFEAETDALKMNYDRQSDEAKYALDKRLATIDLEEKNVIRAEEKKNAARLKYIEEDIKRAKTNLDAKLALEDTNLQNTITIVNEKYLLEQTYHQNLKNLADTGLQYSLQVDSKQLDGMRDGVDSRIEIAKKETEATRIEYDKQTEMLLNAVTKRGTTVREDIELRGVALVKETELTTKELSARKISWVKYGEDVFRVIEKGTLDQQSESRKQTQIVERELDDRIVVLKTYTTETVAELNAQGVQWEVFNGNILKTTTSTYGEIKKNFSTLSDDEKKMFKDVQAKMLSSLDERKADYSKYVEALKKDISSLEAAEIASINKINSLKQKQLDSKDTYKEAIRKNNQSVMTDEQKLADDLLNIQETMNQAKMTGNTKYTDDVLSKINSLAAEYKTADGKVVKSAQDMMSLKNDLYKSNYALQERLIEQAIKKEEEHAKSVKESLEATKKSLDEATAKIKELDQLEVKIKADAALTAFDTILTKIGEVVKTIKDIYTNAPIEINTTQLEVAMDAVKSTLEGIKVEMQSVKDAPIEVSVKGAEGIDLNEYLNLVKGSLDTFQQYVGTDLKPALKVDFKATGIPTKENLPDAIDEVKVLVGTIPTALEEMKPTILIGVQVSLGEAAVSFVDGIKSLATKMETLKAPTESTHTIHVKGLQDLESAIAYHDKLDGKHTRSTHTVTVKTVKSGGGESDTDSATTARTGGYVAARLGGFIQYLKNGGAFNGVLPGYGGGDIVNARLEPGEFVLRKEAVKKIGVESLRQWNNLNSAALKSINPQSGSTKADSMFTGQLHTINLNVGGESHQVYAQSSSLNGLTSSLRRARLTRA